MLIGFNNKKENEYQKIMEQLYLNSTAGDNRFFWFPVVLISTDRNGRIDRRVEMVLKINCTLVASPNARILHKDLAGVRFAAKNTDIASVTEKRGTITLPSRLSLVTKDGNKVTDIDARIENIVFEKVSTTSSIPTYRFSSEKGYLDFTRYDADEAYCQF